MKKLHPIRKMQQAEMDVWAGRGGGRASSLTDLNNQSIKVLARHVKPLLDALEEVLRKFSISGDHEFCDEACEVKMAGRLLAEWRRPL